MNREIAGLDRVSPETGLAVLEEYYRMEMTQAYVSAGGTDYANKLLLKAFGEDGAREMLQHMSRAAEMNASKLDSLQKVDPQQLAKFIEGNIRRPSP